MKKNKREVRYMQGLERLAFLQRRNRSKLTGHFSSAYAVDQEKHTFLSSTHFLYLKSKSKYSSYFEIWALMRNRECYFISVAFLVLEINITSQAQSLSTTWHPKIANINIGRHSGRSQWPMKWKPWLLRRAPPHDTVKNVRETSSRLSSSTI